MRLVDTHAHLNHEELEPRVEEVLARAHAAGVEKVVVVGYDVPSSERAVRLARDHPGLYAAVGMHPYEAGRAGEAEISRIADLARDERVVAIGEIGLDYHGDGCAPREIQEHLLHRQLQIAQETSLPAVIHQRASGLDILGPLRAFPAVTPVFHCFSGDASLLSEGLAVGAYISFAGPITFRSNGDLRLLAADVPPERLLIETDSPYLAPVPHRGRTNEPAFVADTLRALAAARSGDPEELAAQTAANAEALFGLAGRPIMGES